MKYSGVLFLLILFSLTVFPQKPKTAKKTSGTTRTSAQKLGTEKQEFDKAVAVADSLDRIKALQKFLKNFPDSAEKNRALELIVSARAQIGDDKLRLNEIETGVAFFKNAVKDAPVPVSDELFTNLMLQFPTNLFSRGQSAAANEVARMLEEKIGENPKHILALATFYLGTENASEAKRLAEKAIQAENNLTEKPETSNLPGAYQMLGLASRMNFEFDESAAAYAKALELDAASTVSRRGLAEMKRALGKPDEAAALYKEILQKDAADAAAQTGLILSLFDSGKRAEAETEMTKSLEANPNNLFLLVGAAYWYAAHGDGAKAVDLANKAIAVEPRYTWSYIALARGQMALKQPLDAEKTLLSARIYGDFPTLDYELATARAQAGLYREAADTLKRLFFVKNDYVKAWIGNRVPLEAKSFLELLSVERRASIFAPLAADSTDNAEKLKSLLELSQRLDAADAGETEVVDLADRFISGEDNMKLHRQLFVARRLLEQKKSLPKVLEITQSALGKVDAALDVASPSSSVLADELYASRASALARGELIIIPTIQRQTLSKILRGEIEQISGAALLQQNKSSEAVVRLKRALTVLPEKSSWWRAGMWRLGSALEADGKPAEALDSYIKSYTDSEPDAGRYLIIEALYQRINGNTEGLAQRIGVRPSILPASLSSQTVAQNTEVKTETNPFAAPSPTTEATPQTSADATPAKTETQPSPVPAETKPTETITTETSVRETPAPSPVTNTETKTEPVQTETETKTEPAQTEPAQTESAQTKPTPALEVKVENTLETLAKTEAPKTEAPKTETSETEPAQNEPAKTEPAKTNESSTAPKPLFEPIIITIPKTEPVKKTQTDEAKKTETSSGETRDRTVKRERTEETEPCSIVVNQESVSILNNGGSLGVLVGFEKEGDLEQIKASSSSPQDVEVVYQPDIGETAGRAFFLIKSISANKGSFTLTFEAPCGKKEIAVKVR